MTMHDATETAYKNGYRDGYSKGRAEGYEQGRKSVLAPNINCHEDCADCEAMICENNWD